MVELIPLFLFMFLPLQSFGAQSNWATDASWAQQLPPGDSEVPQKALPPLVSQDTFGICYAAAASTVMNFEMCKQGKIQDCQSLPEAKRISALGIARYAAVDNTGKVGQEDSKYDKIKIGSSGARILKTASEMATPLPSQACSSLERITSKIPVGDVVDATRAQEAIWKDLEKSYDGYRKALKDKCDSCASKYYMSAVETTTKGLKLEEDEKSDSSAKRDNTKVLEAFKQDTWEKALNTLLYSKQCSDKGVSLPNPTGVVFDYFPHDPQGVKSDQLLEQIKTVLRGGKPAILDRICVNNCDTKPEYHSVVIAGYRKICSKTKPDDCRQAVKVVNSWGANWQKRNNDGWVETSTLLSNASIVRGSVSWLSDVK